MAFPTSVNSQITDSVTQDSPMNTHIMQELIGNLISALGSAAQKGLEKKDLINAIKYAVAIADLESVENK